MFERICLFALAHFLVLTLNEYNILDYTIFLSLPSVL